MFADFEKDISKLQKSIASPMWARYFPNRRYLGESPSCQVITPRPFVFNRKFFSGEELRRYERLYAMEIPVGGMPQNYELFVLYKRAEEMNAEVAHANHYFDLGCQRRLTLDYQAQVNDWEFMLNSRFFARVVSKLEWIPDRPMESLLVGKRYFSQIQGPIREAFFLPLFVELLNRVPCNFARWISAEQLREFEGVLRRATADLAPGDRRFLFTPCVIQALEFLMAPSPALLGHRFLRLAEFLKRVDTFDLGGRYSGPGVRPNRVECVAFLMAQSQNPALMETVSFLHQVVFAPDVGTFFLPSRFAEKWCVLQQALLCLINTNVVLIQRLSELKFT
jgi:hypothetical protein